jgi:HAD superfamily phosphatase (TIGR01668 family)
MENYVPDIYSKSIYTIDYQKLISRGIKCLLLDLDNTIVPPSFKRPTRKAREFMEELKGLGFKIIIISNSGWVRLKPFKEDLGIDVYGWARKPLPHKFLEIMDKYHYNVSEVAIIGDQIMTDIIGGNNVGITTILINPISPKEKVLTKFNRFRERRVLDKLRDADLFIKGKYYD